MKRQGELGVIEERKEAKRAVSRPLHQHGLGPVGDRGFDKRKTLAHDLDPESRNGQRAPVNLPAGHERLFRIVKQADVARESIGDSTGDSTRVCSAAGASCARAAPDSGRPARPRAVGERKPLPYLLLSASRRRLGFALRD
jgi:hypothetical protein